MMPETAQAADDLRARSVLPGYADALKLAKQLTIRTSGWRQLAKGREWRLTPMLGEPVGR